MSTLDFELPPPYSEIFPTSERVNRTDATCLDGSNTDLINSILSHYTTLNVQEQVEHSYRTDVIMRRERVTIIESSQSDEDITDTIPTASTSGSSEIFPRRTFRISSTLMEGLSQISSKCCTYKNYVALIVFLTWVISIYSIGSVLIYLCTAIPSIIIILTIMCGRSLLRDKSKLKRTCGAIMWISVCCCDTLTYVGFILLCLTCFGQLL